jgi:Aluminium induced protein
VDIIFVFGCVSCLPDVVLPERCGCFFLSRSPIPIPKKYIQLNNLFIIFSKCIYCRLFGAVDDIFCLFQGNIENITSLKQQYGLSNSTANEVIILIEAYRSLRDRGPFHPSNVARDLVGKFSFILFDTSRKSTFIATVSK